MIQSLNTYNYDEQLRMIPRNFEVTISDLDKVIKIMEDGSLLAELGLDLRDGILTLTGKEGLDVASVELPGSQVLKGGIYDKNTQEIVLYIINADSSEDEIRIDVADLVDVYQEGKGIEIDDEKRISIKIKENSATILDVNEDGLGINLNDYATLLDLENEKTERVVNDSLLNTKLDNEIAERIGGDSLLSENILLVDTKLDNEITERIESVDVLSSALENEIVQRVNADDNILTILDEKVPFTKAIKDGVEYNTIQLDNYANLLGYDTTGGSFNLAMVSKWNVADFGSSKLHTNLNSKDKITVNDIEKIAYESDLDNIVSGITIDLDNIKQSVADEVIAREDGDTLLNKRVDDEIIVREEGDNLLDDKIEIAKQAIIDEETRAISKETELKSEIENEIKPRLIDVENNKVSYTILNKDGMDTYNICLDNDSSFMSMSNGGNKYNVIKLSNTNHVEVGTVSMPMNLRSSERITVNYGEQIAYVSEISGATSDVLDKIEANRVAIIAEETRAVAKENSIELLVGNEEARAIGVESALSLDIANVNNSLSEEITRAKDNEAVIKTSLDDEIARAIASENNLETKLDKKVEWVDISTPTTINRKSIVLNNNDLLIGKTTTGSITPLIFMNKWDVVDAGASNVKFNINTPFGIRPTVQEAGQTGENANKIAYLSDVEKVSDDKVSEVYLKQDLSNPLHYILMVDGVEKGDINIPKDQFLKEATFDADTKELIFIFMTSEGEKEVKVDVSKLVDIYTAGDGLKLELNEFSIDFDIAASKVSVDDAINDFKAADAALSDKIVEEANRAIAAEEELKNSKVSWSEIGTSGRKTIILNNNDVLLGTDTKGTTYALSMVSKWDVADFGSSSLPLNLNSSVIPTVQLPGQSGSEAKHIALSEDVTTSIDKIESEYKASDVLLKNEIVNNLQINKDYSDDNLTKANTYSDTKFNEGKTYTDEQIAETKIYADNKFDDGKTYTDEQIVISKSYTDEKLVESKKYTDDKVQGLVDNVDFQIDAKVDPLKFKFNDYSTTVEMSKAIDDSLVVAKKYTDDKVLEGIGQVSVTIDNKISSAITKSEQSININITKNSNNINKLSTGLDNTPYTGGTGIVDDVYKKVHALINGLDEAALVGLLSKLQVENTVLKNDLKSLENRVIALEAKP